VNELSEVTIEERATQCLTRLRAELLAERTPAGHWTGELSSSALSTATAVSALSMYMLEVGTVDDGSEFDSKRVVDLITRGSRYLDSQQNADGGFGDTDRSHSNIATSYLVLSARTLASKIVDDANVVVEESSLDRLNRYIESAGAIDGLRKRYGTDKTFVVPILTNLAIAGLVDWKMVPRLPFEVSVFPGSFYRFLRMPVVSYAIPALVAIGQANHFLGPKAWLPLRACRSAAVNRSTRVLRQMQPESGGYLEATPLTSFVLMSLAASMNARSSDSEDVRSVMRQCVRFLCDSFREDGSWPIDTNLATWITSLAIHSLSRGSNDDRSWLTKELIDWHLGCQHQVRHPFTGASPGGWGWSDLSGAVPDGDDTPAAILAATHFYPVAINADGTGRIDQAIEDGLGWLAKLQNRDGGLPTFCRGWGKLPFDRSSTDLTAHFLRAIDQAEQGRAEGHFGAENGTGNEALWTRLPECKRRATAFLKRTQRADGSWLPLWFGNQDNEEDENPIYGTGRVLIAIAGDKGLKEHARRAADFLLATQNRDGGWGGGMSIGDYFGDARVCSSIEETAVALEAIAQYAGKMSPPTNGPDSGRVLAIRQAIIAAVECLVEAVEADRHRHAWPIGFYFAKLWYYEKLYPYVFPVAALSAAIEILHRPPHKVETSH
jgi:squalene-hopene/tetraprenyl-beta-curcumene cyclase